MKYILVLALMGCVADRNHAPTDSLAVHPAATTAQCRDSTYSKSLSRAGSCAKHNGVLRWFR